MKYLLALSILLLSSLAQSATAPMFFDGAVNGMFLLDQKSGNMRLKGFSPNCKDVVMPAYCFVNTGRTQKIMLVVHPGDHKSSIAEVAVEKFSGAALPEFPVSITDFETSKGIKLGISKKELVSKLGEPHKKNGNTYQYMVVSDKYLINTYNMPIYCGKYTFDKGKLISFRYGFEYP